jgi:hypothetical protein
MAANGFAQTVLWDGESYDEGSRGGCWDDGAPTVVANPDQSGINTSSKCLKFTMTSSSKVVKIPFRDWIKPDLASNRRVSLMIRKTNNTNVQIELSDPTNDGAAGFWEKTAAWYGNSGQWQRVVFDFSTNTKLGDHPGVMSITASTDDVASDEDVYIDNIVIEPLPMVNGTELSKIEDGSLKGNLTLTGSWMKGDCQNTDGTWTKVEYDDFSKLAAKLNSSVTSVNLQGARVKDAYNAFENVNPNIIVYTDDAFNGDNMVSGGKTSKLVLNEGYAFAAPTGFTADNVEVTRELASGYNTICLPFAYTAAEQGATAVAKYASTSTADDIETVTFNTVETASANLPYVLSGTTASSTLTFTNKTIEATPASLTDGLLNGVYAVTDGEGKWGIGDQVFQKGAAGATFNSFHAYLSESVSAAKVAFAISDATGIKNINAENTAADGQYYTLNGVRVNRNNLQKGIYIINHKKVIVK